MRYEYGDSPYASLNWRLRCPADMCASRARASTSSGCAYSRSIRSRTRRSHARSRRRWTSGALVLTCQIVPRMIRCVVFRPAHRERSDAVDGVPHGAPRRSRVHADDDRGSRADLIGGWFGTAPRRRSGRRVVREVDRELGVDAPPCPPGRPRQGRRRCRASPRLVLGPGTSVVSRAATRTLPGGAGARSRGPGARRGQAGCAIRYRASRRPCASGIGPCVR